MEHVIWETPEGQWSHGQFQVDSEEVTDYSRFAWVSTNHHTKDAAIYSGTSDVPYTVILYGGNEEQVAEYEKMASELND